MGIYNTILRSGVTLVIFDEKGHYDPAKFWIRNGKLFSWAPELGTWERDGDLIDRLDDHIENMLNLGLTIKLTKD